MKISPLRAWIPIHLGVIGLNIVAMAIPPFILALNLACGATILVNLLMIFIILFKENN
jgi:hypothetical protein